MKDNNFKEQVGKVRSLIERVDGNMSPYEASENEKQRIDEATSKNRVQVTRDEILDILDKADDEQDRTNMGLFATVTYANAAIVYKKKSYLDIEKVSSSLDKHKEMGDEEWHKKLSSFIKPETKGDNPITSVINVTRYTIKWHSPKNYAYAYDEYNNALTTLRQRNGIALDSAGVLGDNHNIRQNSGYGKSKFNQTGKLARDFNFAGVKRKSKAYFVNDLGRVVSEMPGDVVESIISKKKKYDAEASVSSVLSGPALEAYIKAKKEIDSKFVARNLLYDKILCICCAVNGTSYYYINDKLMTNISKNSSVYVNQEDMLNIAKEQLGESFDAIQGFSK